MAASHNSNSRQNNNASTNQPLSIYVGNLSFNINEEDLEGFFNENCGNVKKVYIVYDKYTGQSRGFGFVQFNTMDSFNAAFNLNQCQLDGRQLRISAAETKNSSSTSTAVAPQTTNTPKTQVVHCKKSKYDVYIGRPSDWGNPFVIGKDGDRDAVIQKYRNWIMHQPDLLPRVKKELRGQRIACWCKPEACHGDVLAEIADAD